MVTQQVSLPTYIRKRKGEKKEKTNFILILAQLIQSAFTLTSNHYAPLI